MLREFLEFLLAEIILPAVKNYLIQELIEFLRRFLDPDRFETVWEFVLHLLGL